MNDPYPEMMFSSHHSGNLDGSELEETHHMVRGVPEEIRNRHHMVTGVQEMISYCSPGTSSGKQKKARSTSQHIFAVRTLLRQLKQTRYSKPFSNWGRTIFSNQFQQKHQQNLKIAQIPHNDNAHLRWEIKEIRTV